MQNLCGPQLTEKRWVNEIMYGLVHKYIFWVSLPTRQEIYLICQVFFNRNLTTIPICLMGFVLQQIRN